MTDDKIARFWDNFINISKRYGINPDAVRWPVRHADLAGWAEQKCDAKKLL